ncbi:MAG: SGNH/GDSL hydrolase family protein [Hyphomonadaceae bacterium]|nr:SGNH/GDSL hydrolase family protein [Hyphomonadaceae bacterium]
MWRMILWVLGALFALAAITVGIVAYQGAQRPTNTPQYVALGSSYSAGIGLGEPIPGAPLMCATGLDGYPQQLARRTGMSIVDRSCSGATTAHVLTGRQYFQPAQLDFIDQRTELVTLTIGGNDLFYVGDLMLLAAAKDQSFGGWLARRAARTPPPASARDIDGVRTHIKDIILEARRRAPRARIIVVTYPVILPPQGTCEKAGLTAEEVAIMREVGARLAQATREAVAETDATLIDFEAPSAGHDVCAPEPWVNGWRDAVGAQFHPTLAGATAAAQALEAQLESVQ